jgi:hypothetical protein
VVAVEAAVDSLGGAVESRVVAEVADRTGLAGTVGGQGTSGHSAGRPLARLGFLPFLGMARQETRKQEFLCSYQLQTRFMGW